MKRKTWLSLGWSLAVLLLAPAAFGQQALVSKFISGAIPLDPLHTLWEKAQPVTVDLHGQVITTPMLQKGSVNSVSVKSVTNGAEIAFLLVWQDSTENRSVSIGKFSDAVAVQIPYVPKEDVPITMGGAGQRVLILHWAAFRQENIDHGYFDTAKAEPNYTYDWYPHAQPPYKYPEDWQSPYALNYVGGEKVLRKNTLNTPVREVVAEGFGSSTWKDIQGAEGKGIYKDGKWLVVIKRKFIVQNTSNPEWSAGKNTFVNFAVWDGANNERGARKSLEFAWTPLTIEER